MRLEVLSADSLLIGDTSNTAGPYKVPLLFPLWDWIQIGYTSR